MHSKKTPQRSSTSTSSPKSPTRSSIPTQPQKSQFQLGILLNDDDEAENTSPPKAKSSLISTSKPPTPTNSKSSFKAIQPHPVPPSSEIPNASGSSHLKPPAPIAERTLSDTPSALTLIIPETIPDSLVPDSAPPTPQDPMGNFASLIGVTRTLNLFKKKAEAKRESRSKRQKALAEAQKDRILCAAPVAIQIQVFEDALPCIYATVNEYKRLLGVDHPIYIQSLNHAKKYSSICGIAPTDMPEL
ncbi:hypothetical protein RCL1_005408 [Eukaryota sp. TZLM3-RCL]